MHYTGGFVTNSSSSSFICEVCGDVQAGYDMGLDDAGMYECEKGHIFCESHVITPNLEQKIQFIKRKKPSYVTYPFANVTEDKVNEILGKEFQIIEYMEEDEVVDVYGNYGEDYDRYCYPSLYCPICNLSHIPDYLKIKYLLKELGKNSYDLDKEIRAAYEDWDDLINNL